MVDLCEKLGETHLNLISVDLFDKESGILDKTDTA
jgi:hypothetical protein